MSIAATSAALVVATKVAFGDHGACPTKHESTFNHTLCRPFDITAFEIGTRATPPMLFDGPHREDEAALANVGFWY